MSRREIETFMSVRNYSLVLKVLRDYTNEINVIPELYGVQLNKLVYRAMMDIDAENYDVSVPANNQMIVQIVGRFILSIRNDGLNTAFAVQRQENEVCNIEEGVGVGVGVDKRQDVDFGDAYDSWRKGVDRSIAETGSSHLALRPDLAGMFRNTGRPKCDDGDGPLSATAAELIMPRPPMVTVRKYLLVNGYDRDWLIWKDRYHFRVDLADSSSDFHNVRRLAATRLIIPREVIEERTPTFVPKKSFEEQFGLHYPYLMLYVDDFQNVYKGSNHASQRAFAHFMFDTVYTGANGRGFIQLKPMQDEALEFPVNAISQLSQMVLSVRRPSGVLMNDSQDSTMIRRFDYNNYVGANLLWIRVTLTNHHDRNEFFSGDNIRFRDFVGDSTTNAGLVDWVNREQGHEITSFGTANTSGYVRSFHIKAPGVFNRVTGTYDVNTQFTHSLNAYFQSAAYVASPPQSVATCINASLQITVSFEVDVDEPETGGVYS